MKLGLNTFVARGTLTFTVSVIFISCLNLIDGQKSVEYSFLLEILGLIICIELLDFLFSIINFHSRILYTVAEFAAMYICYMVFAISGHWFGFKFIKLLIGSITFLFFFAGIHLYYHFALSTKAQKINSNLEKIKNNQKKV